MKRVRPRDGVIITIAPDSPVETIRTVRLSAAVLSRLRMAAFLLVLVVVLTLAQLWSGRRQLVDLRASVAELETAIDDRESELSLRRAQLEEASVATAHLLDELGSVGAALRELESLAGLEPIPLAFAQTPEVGPLAGPALGGPYAGERVASSVDAIRTDVDGLAASVVANLSLLSVGLEAVRDTVADREARAEARPRLWPVAGWISSEFGWRRSPISGRTLLHQGVDLVAPFRTPVAAGATGRVVTAGWSDRGYGYHVVIDHGYGFSTLYGHLNEIAVEVGQELVLGDTVGLLGSTGQSTGPHLHYEVWENGVAIDPIAFLPN